MTAKVHGLDKLRRKLRALPRVARQEVKRAMETGANEMVALMISLCPKEEGDLAASIGWTWGDAPAGSVTIAQADGGSADLRLTIYAGNERTIVTNKRGVQFQNALIQEFGTKDMPANPYFFVSYRALRRRVKSRISRSYTKAARKVAAGGA